MWISAATFDRAKVVNTTDEILHYLNDHPTDNTLAINWWRPKPDHHMLRLLRS